MRRWLLTREPSRRFATALEFGFSSSIENYNVRSLAFSTSTSTSTSNKKPKSSIITVLKEHPSRPHRPIVVYTLTSIDPKWSTKTIVSEEDPFPRMSKHPSWKRWIGGFPKTFVHMNIVSHFLPADHPSSVAHGYARFAFLSCCASIAGSAAMVLSTQTLLLAVGVVGHSGSDSSNLDANVLAGALNWVLKDGIGQIGGVWFASFMGRSSRISPFDASPKYWRMVSALALDVAAILELTSPWVSSSTQVLIVASIANVGKNIGFLTASASRAALHQSLAKMNNLADVTAKAGSQSMAASLMGTAVGIGLSPILGDVTHFVLAFVGLSLIHQGCNYLALKAVPLAYFDRHRFHLVLDTYFKEGIVLDPTQVACRESFLPYFPSDDSHTWLSLGSTISDLGGPAKAESSLCTCHTYILVSHNMRLHLVFHENAQASDMIQGMHHAYWLHHRGDDDAVNRIVHLQAFKAELVDKGWNLAMLRVEPPNAVRISKQ